MVIVAPEETSPRRRLVGFDRSSSFGGDHVETARWVGKPWRRVELVVHDAFYRGERVDRSWDFSVTVGLMRWPYLHLHGSLTRAPGADYSDEPHQ